MTATITYTDGRTIPSPPLGWAAIGTAMAPRSLPAEDVPGGQVGQGAAAPVVVLDPHRAGFALAQSEWQRQRA